MRAGRRAGLDLARVHVSRRRRARILLAAAAAPWRAKAFSSSTAVRHRPAARRRRPHRSARSGFNSRTGEFHVIKARVDHRRHQRHHVPLRLRARHHRHRHAARLSRGRGAAQCRIQLRAAGHAEILFRGHHLRDPGGRAFHQRQGRGVHARLRAGLGRRGRRAAHRPCDGDGTARRAATALSRHVGDPGRASATISSEQSQVDGLFLPQARRAKRKHRHVRQDALLRAQPDDQDGHPHRAGLPLGCRRASGGGARAGRLRQPLRRLPHRPVHRQRLDRGRTARSRTSTGCRRRTLDAGQVAAALRGGGADR